MTMPLLATLPRFARRQPEPMPMAFAGLFLASGAPLWLPGGWAVLGLVAGGALCWPLLRTALPAPAPRATPALRDTETGLYSAAVVQAAVPAMLRMAERHGAGSCLALLVIDQPRPPVAEIGVTITGALRGTDLVCRHGEDGFLIVLPDCDLGGAFERLDELRGRFATLGGARRYTASIGLASVAQGAADLHDATMAATAAVRTAIAGGRNRVVTAPMVARLQVMQGAMP